MSRRRRRPGPSALLALLLFPVVLAARFLAGRVLWRRVSYWDARYLAWAPDPPPWVYAMRDEPHPRTRWARRPGWQRQVARLAPLVAVAAAAHAPTADSITAAVLALGAVALVVTRRRPRPRSTARAQDAGAPLLETRPDAARRAVPPPRSPATAWDDPEAGQLYTPGHAHRVDPQQPRR